MSGEPEIDVTEEARLFNRLGILEAQAAALNLKAYRAGLELELIAQAHARGDAVDQASLQRRLDAACDDFVSQTTARREEALSDGMQISAGRYLGLQEQIAAALESDCGRMR